MPVLSVSTVLTQAFKIFQIYVGELPADMLLMLFHLQEALRRPNCRLAVTPLSMPMQIDTAAFDSSKHNRLWLRGASVHGKRPPS